MSQVLAAHIEKISSGKLRAGYMSGEDENNDIVVTKTDTVEAEKSIRLR